MKIVTDQDILAVDNSFSQWGELIKIPGREICNNDLLDADALLVRSITTVNEELLTNTSISFVASATAGTDHIDLPYLENQHIGFAHAPGANANAVVDYCFAALAKIALDKQITLQQFLSKTFAIIGAGNVGGLFYNKLIKLDVDCAVHDPILQQHRPRSLYKFCSLEQAMSADIVSLHVPMTVQQPHATAGMVNQKNLPLLPSDAILINTSRGGVVDESFLKSFLDRRPDVSSVVDVWCNEPDPDLDLINRIDIATPHIAGYSFDAKNAATRMIAEAFVTHFGLQASAGATDSQSTAGRGVLTLGTEDKSAQRVFVGLLEAFPVQDLNVVFKTLGQRGMLSENFDLLRKQIAQRREFFVYGVNGADFDAAEIAYLTALGMIAKP